MFNEYDHELIFFIMISLLLEKKQNKQKKNLCSTFLHVKLIEVDTFLHVPREILLAKFGLVKCQCPLPFLRVHVHPLGRLSTQVEEGHFL